MISKTELASIREDGAVNGLQRSLTGILARATASLQSIIQAEFCTADGFREKIEAAREALKDAEIIAAELDAEGHDIVGEF